MSERLTLAPDIVIAIQRDEIAGKQQRIERLEAVVASFNASLDDANATIKRLSAEKASLERVLHTIKENIGAY